MNKRMWVTGGLAMLVMVVAAVLLVGCSSDFAPTLPSPGGGGGGAADICGTVTNPEGAPVEGATVTVSDGEEMWSAVTDADGTYCISNVPEGSLGLTVGAEGFETEYRTLTFEGTNITQDVLMDTPVGSNPTECPVVQLSSEDFDDTAGTVVVTGTVTNTDTDSVILFQDGQPSITGLSSGNLSQLAFLHPGDNVFVAMVSNANCSVLSDPLTVTWTPPEGSDFVFRVTMIWDTPTSDPDLHTWSPEPNVQHSAYWNKTIDAGQLDVDDTEGFGPENFTNDVLTPGRFHIAVDSYDLDEETTYDVTIRVITGGLAANSVVRTLGPHTFTTDDSETYPVEPPSWWRPCDIIVSDTGVVSVVAPDNTVLPQNPSSASAAARPHAK